MILSYYDFLLNETEIDEINQTIYNGNIDLEYAPKKPSPQNAAFDEFFSGIVVFLDSNEVQAFLAAVDIFLIFLNIVKRVKEYAANKKAYKVTSSTIEPLLNNVIIQVDNKKILEPQRFDSIKYDEYLFLALQACKVDSYNKNEDIIISLDIRSRFVEMFGDLKDRRTIADLCSIITDGTHQPPKFSQSGIPFLFVSNIVKNEIT